MQAAQRRVVERSSNRRKEFFPRSSSLNSKQSAKSPRTPRKLKPDRALDIDLTILDGDRAGGNAGAIFILANPAARTRGNVISNPRPKSRFCLKRFLLVSQHFADDQRVFWRLIRSSESA